MDKTRKIFLDDLPKYENGKNNGQINWKKSIGYKVKFIYDDIEGDIEIINHEPKKSRLSIKYNNIQFDILTGSLQKCCLGKLLNKYTTNFKMEIGTRLQDDKRDITITNREYRPKHRKDKKKENQKWYKYTCNVCDWSEGWIEEGALIKGNGCSCCRGLTVVEGINDIPTTAPELIKYFQGGVNEAKLYTKSSSKKIYALCPDCGRIKYDKIQISTINSMQGIGCICSDGIKYPNKFAYSLLENLNIDFETEKNFNWCKYKIKEKIKMGRYDLYFNLKDKEYILEMDGGFHEKDNTRSGQTKEESKFLDDEKDRLAKEHNIKVIRIDCNYPHIETRFEFIKQNILESKLNELFDLSKVNWKECEKFALSNRVKEACDLWNDGSHSVREIEKLMKLSNTTIRDYLKKGCVLNWCNYNASKEKIKGAKIMNKLNQKPVRIFKDKIKLGEFESAIILSNLSEKLFGVKLTHSCICNACRNNNTYKNFDFEYIKEVI